MFLAVIGAGVGGSAVSYFLSNLTGGEVQIDVFEKSNLIGGRTATIKVFGNDYETGGAVLHPKNQYAADLVNELGTAKK